MTEPIRPTRCQKCGWLTTRHAPDCPYRRGLDSAELLTLLACYTDLRRDCIAIEEMLGRGEGMSPEDLKRIDKAVTVMKVGFKMVKRVLRKNGATDTNLWREREGVA